MALNPNSNLPKRGTAAQWTTANPVLGEGETGYEIDTRRSKRGDGITAWVGLAYGFDQILGDTRYATAAQGSLAGTAVQSVGLDTAVSTQVTTPGTATAVALTAAFAKSGLPAYAGFRTRTYDPATGLYNRKDANWRKWRVALAQAKAGTGFARLTCYGDSITQGATNLVPNIRTNSWVSRVRTMFDTEYGAAGSGMCYIQPDADDTRYVKSGTHWTSYTNFAVFGDWCQYNAGTLGEYLSWTDTCDSFTIMCLGSTAGSNGSRLAVSIDGGAVTNYPVVLASNQPLAIVVPAGTVGVHTIQIAVADVGHPLWIMGVEPTIGAAGVRVTRWGRGNATAGWMVSGINNDAGSPTTGSIPFSFNVFPPDLSIINFGVNEYLTNVSVTTFTTNMQTIVSKALSYGNVLLMTTIPNGATTGVPAQSALDSAIYDLADANDVPLLDLSSRWQSYVASASLYSAGGGPTHPNIAGQFDMAVAVYRAIRDR